MPKCFICKRDIPKGEAYSWYHMSNTGRLYKKNCCSEEELQRYNKEIEYRKKIYETLLDYMGYDVSQLIPNIVTKQIEELHKGYTYRIIYNVIRSMEHNIRLAMKKDFKSDFAKGKYLIAILSNNINDEYEKLKRETKIERNRAKTQPVEIENIEWNNPRKKNKRDISEFLD